VTPNPSTPDSQKAKPLCTGEALACRTAARLVIILASVWSGSALVQSAPVDAAQPCKAKFGDVVDFRECNPVTLPGVEVEFLNITSPNPQVPLSCWNYKATDSSGKEATFRQCHTGLLGGGTSFTVADKTFTVFFDVATGCRRWPAGNWAPAGRGHAFLAGIPDTKRFVKIRDDFQNAEERCFARK
jgi:hypothetical protein